MKRFFFGVFTGDRNSASPQARALKVVSVHLSGAEVRKAVFNEAVAPGPRGDQFGFDFVLEAWLGAPNQVSDSRALLSAAAEAGIDPRLSRTVLAEERIIKAGTAPIKGTFLSKRKPGTSVAEYQSYWRNQHAEIIQAQKDFFSFVRAYVQNHFVEGSYRSLDGEPIEQDDAFDGAPQMWFDSVEDIYSAFKTEGYTRHIRADEHKLVKVGFSQSFIAREHDLAIRQP
jgi:hypothetical protein